MASRSPLTEVQPMQQHNPEASSAPATSDVLREWTAKMFASPTRLPRSPVQWKVLPRGNVSQAGSCDSPSSPIAALTAARTSTSTGTSASSHQTPRSGPAASPALGSPSRLLQPGFRASPDAKSTRCVNRRSSEGRTMGEGGAAATTSCESSLTEPNPIKSPDRNISVAASTATALKVDEQMSPAARTPMSPPEHPESGYSVHSNAIFGDSEVEGEVGSLSPPVVSLWEGHASPNSFGSPALVTGGALPSRVTSPTGSPSPPPAPSNAASPFDAYWVQTNEAFVPLGGADAGQGGVGDGSGDKLRRNDSAITDQRVAGEVEVSIDCGSIPTTVHQPRSWAASSELPAHLQASAPVLMRQRPAGDPLQRLASTQGGVGCSSPLKRCTLLRPSPSPHDAPTSTAERTVSEQMVQVGSGGVPRLGGCHPSGLYSDRRSTTPALSELSPNFYRRQWGCIVAAHRSASRRRRQQAVLLLKWRTWTIEEQALRGAKFEHGIRTMLKLRNSCLQTGYLLSFAWLRWVTVCRHRLAAVQIAEALAEQTLSLSVLEEEQCQQSMVDGDVSLGELTDVHALPSDTDDLVTERFLTIWRRHRSRKLLVAMLQAWLDTCLDTPSGSCEITLSLAQEDLSETLLPPLRAWAQCSRSGAFVEAALVARCRRVSDRRRVIWAWRRWADRLDTLRNFQRDALRLFNNLARRRLTTAWRTWRSACGAARVLDHKLDAGYQRILLAKAFLGLSPHQAGSTATPVLPSAKFPTPRPTVPKAPPSTTSQKRAPSTMSRKPAPSTGCRPPKSPSYVSMVSRQYPNDVHLASSIRLSTNGTPQEVEWLSDDAVAVRELKTALRSLQSDANARITYQNGRLAHLRGVVYRMALGHACERRRRALFAAFARWRCQAALGRLSMKPYRSDPFVVVKPPSRKESTWGTNSYVQVAKMRQPTSAGPSSRPPSASPRETQTSGPPLAIAPSSLQRKITGLDTAQGSEAVGEKCTGKIWRADTPPVSPSLALGGVPSGFPEKAPREWQSYGVTSVSADSSSVSSTGRRRSPSGDEAESQSPTKRRCATSGSRCRSDTSSASTLAALGLEQLQAIAEVPLVDLTASVPRR